MPIIIDNFIFIELVKLRELEAVNQIGSIPKKYSQLTTLLIFSFKLF